MRYAKQVRDSIWLNEFEVNILNQLVKYYDYNENDAIDLILRFKNVLSRVRDIDYRYAANKIHSDQSPDTWEKYLNTMDEMIGMVVGQMRFPETKNKAAEICRSCGFFKYVNEPCTHCS